MIAYGNAATLRRRRRGGGAFVSLDRITRSSSRRCTTSTRAALFSTCDPRTGIIIILIVPAVFSRKMAADEFVSGDGPLPSSEVLGWYAFKSTFSLIAAGVFGITRGRSAPPLSNNEHLGAGERSNIQSGEFPRACRCSEFPRFRGKKGSTPS